MSGECHCLSEYTGQNCELRLDTTTMPDRMMSSRTALIVGTVVGSVLGTSIIVTGIVLVLALFFIFKKYKKRWGTLRISSSQQLSNKNENQNEKVILESCVPTYDDAQLPSAKHKTEDSVKKDI